MYIYHVVASELGSYRSCLHSVCIYTYFNEHVMLTYTPLLHPAKFIKPASRELEGLERPWP